MTYRCHRSSRLAAARDVAGVLVLLLAGCEHDAWLGRQCSASETRCDDAGCAARSGVFDAGRSLGRTANVAGQLASGDAAPPLDDASSAPLPDAAAPECRRVMMGYFACASSDEMPGIPQLRAGHAYTLRFRGDYTVDTTLQLQGATSACAAMTIGTLTLAAGVPAVERCLRPTSDIALLVTLKSGDVKVWNQEGLMAELCDGCE